MDLSKVISDIVDRKLRMIKLDPSKLIGTQSGYTLPQATETALGGIKAKARTTETAEAAIDASTGKLYVPGAGEAANGLPAGGTAGQMLSKVDGTDYNAEWVDAPSGGTSYANPIDEPPTSPSTRDDEFNDESLDSKWSWVNQGAATWDNVNGRGYASLISSYDTVRMIVQDAPSGDFTVTVKVGLQSPQTDYFCFGIALYNPDNSRRIVFGICHRSTYTGVQIVKFNSDTSYNSNLYLYAWGESAKYFRVSVASGVCSYLVSNDGNVWVTVKTENVSTFLVSLPKIGVGIFRNNTDGNTYYGICDWFRVTA